MDNGEYLTHIVHWLREKLVSSRLLEGILTKILVIDDDRSVRHIVSSGLNGHHGFEVITAADGDAGLALMHEHQPTVCLLDVFLPEYNGIELFRKIRALDRKLPVIFITGDTSSETAIEAMRAGAFDYLAKPLNIEQLRKLTFSASKARKLMDQPVALPVGEGTVDGERFVGNSKSMIEVFKDIGRVASQNVTVLIRGESGSGKELVARALVNHSDRSDRPFVAVNCAAIPDQLLESELFGHEKGSFTGAERRRIGRFEQCSGGTILLDEIGDMSSVIQGKVLRLLQDQKFERVGGNELIATDVRIIAATNRPLEQLAKENEFRDDLLYRLNGFTISLPPLRNRRDDIPALLEYFLRRAKSDMNRPELSGIAPDALELLIEYDWPGNVRQLQSVVRQALLNTTGTVIGSDNLPGFIRNPRLEHDQFRNTNGAAPTTTQGSAGTHSSGAFHGSTAATGQNAEPAPNGQSGELSSHGMPAGNSVGVKEGGVHSHTAEHPLAQGAAAADSQYQAHSAGQSPWAAPGAQSSSSVGHPLSTSNASHADGAAPARAEFSIEDFIEARLQAGSQDLYNELIEQVERRLFASVLAATGGNQSKTAEILGITRGKVRDRIATFDIQLDRTITMGK